MDVHQLVRDRSVRFAVGLTVAVAIPVAILFYFQFRSLADLGQSSTVVLRQLSQETADAVTKDLQDALRAPRVDVLLKIGQRQTEPLDLPFIENTFEQGLAADPFVDGFYVWSEVTAEHRNDLLSFDRDARTFVVNPPETPLLVRQFRELAPEKRAIAVFEAPLNGRRTYYLAQLRFTFPSRDRMTSFVALRVDAERLRTEYIPQLVASKFANVEGPTGFPPLSVTVVDSNKRVIFPPGGSAAKGFVDERTFPLVFYEPDLTQFAAPESGRVEMWHVRTGFGDQSIPEIVAARERPQRAMMAMLAGVMALGVFFVTRAAAREVRLAELKSSFVSSVSHDLKTPLALIQLFAETLELGRLKNMERAPEYYRIINSEARKLTRLINNLLDFSRIEAGLRRYRREPTDLTQLTGRVLESLESQFQHNQFTVTSRLTTPVPVLIDPEAAEQALENLLSNAMKYSPENRDIVVEVVRDGQYGVIRVTDRGVGIPARFHRRIFRKFYRIQTDAGSGPQGTGLGLAIVEHIMRGHGGLVRVDSEPGRGSTFALHFPLFAGDIGRDEANSGDRGRAPDVARTA
ncbi:MAG TPA: HAMP domain-containing sensor histidine kinase [Vicinamibacterales bacterium]|jgi:signal transduction histidine kinase|nr:HAMP domain-containing sensor histidine kinase [Vicinamibacterales bacterium]